MITLEYYEDICLVNKLTFVNELLIIVKHVTCATHFLRVSTCFIILNMFLHVSFETVRHIDSIWHFVKQLLMTILLVHQAISPLKKKYSPSTSSVAQRFPFKKPLVFPNFRVVRHNEWLHTLIKAETTNLKMKNKVF